jgi:hypothetical protein
MTASHGFPSDGRSFSYFLILAAWRIPGVSARILAFGMAAKSPFLFCFGLVWSVSFAVPHTWMSTGGRAYRH